MKGFVWLTEEELAERGAKKEQERQQREQAAQRAKEARIAEARDRAAQSVMTRGGRDKEIIRAILTDAGVIFKEDEGSFVIEDAYGGSRYGASIDFDEFDNLTDVGAYEEYC